jgi:hypothetical protein
VVVVVSPQQQGGNGRYRTVNAVRVFETFTTNRLMLERTKLFVHVCLSVYILQLTDGLEALPEKHPVPRHSDICGFIVLIETLVV